MNLCFLFLFFLLKCSDSYLKYTLIVKKNHTNETKIEFMNILGTNYKNESITLNNIIKKINYKNIIKTNFTDESLKRAALLF
jgi:hypothetical protein